MTSKHINNITSYDKLYISKEDTLILKALAIFLVFFHHYSQVLNRLNIFILFRPLGFIGVTIFLFLSGYGLTEQYQKKINYLNDFFCKTLYKILIPFWLINIIYLLINMKAQYTFSLLHVIGILPIDVTMWYMQFLLVQYMVFYFIFKYNTNNKSKMLLLIVFSLIYLIVCRSLEMQKNYYDISFAFSIGCLFSFYKEEIAVFLFKNRKIIIPSISLLLFLTFIYGVQGGGYPSFYQAIMRIFASNLFIIILIYLNGFIKIKNNIIKYVGIISFYIYLVHYKVLISLSGISNFKLFWYVTITFLLSSLFFQIYTKFLNKLGYSRRRLKSKKEKF